MKLRTFQTLIMACLFLTPAIGQSQQAEIRALFEEPNGYFSRGEAKKISERTVRAPMWRGASPAALYETTADVEALFNRATSTIRAEGYDHSEILGLEIQLVNLDTAIVDMAYRRFLKDGTVMGPQRREATYWVLRTDAGWRITALAPRQR